MELHDKIPKALTPELQFVTQLNIADLYKLQDHLATVRLLNAIYDRDSHTVTSFQGAFFEVGALSVACAFWLDCIENNSILVSIFLGR